MIEKSHAKSKRILSFANPVFLFALTAALIGAFALLVKSYRQIPSQPANQPQAPSAQGLRLTTTTTSKPNQLQVSASPSSMGKTDITAGWKTTVANDLPKVIFSHKYPSEWSSPYDHCNTNAVSNSLELPGNCIKIVIFTDFIPSEDQPVLDNITLTSSSQITVSGFQAKRKIWSYSTGELNTYELWIYDKGQPIMLWLAWIGVRTTPETEADFIQKLDAMVGTLDLHRQ